MNLNEQLGTAVTSQSHDPVQESRATAAIFAETIANSLTLNRLPVPEPTTFAGDPLKFVDFKVSFMTLIDQKPIPASEKMLYLKSYLAGEARKAVEGFFYRSSEDAYKGAWSVLKDRYGNPFVVQKAFRDKLMKWPKIGPSDSLALRDFSDFLKSCAEAMPHVKGLAILNDSEENHKLLKKLPDWIVCKWSRVVVGELDKSGEYPSFDHFTEFVQTEARIACNPIASPFSFSARLSDDKFPKRAKSLNTNAQAKNYASKTSGNFPVSKSRLPCLVCKCSSMVCHHCRRQVDLLPGTLSGSLTNQCMGRRDKRRLCPSLGLSLPGSKARPLPGRTLPSPLPSRWTLLVKVVAVLLQLVWMT